MSFFWRVIFLTLDYPRVCEIFHKREKKIKKKFIEKKFIEKNFIEKKFIEKNFIEKNFST